MGAFYGVPDSFYITPADKPFSIIYSTFAVIYQLAQGTGKKSALIPLEITLFCPTAQAIRLIGSNPVMLVIGTTH